MKKVFLVLFSSIVLTTIALAQPRAMGIRLGGNQEISIQQYINERKFVQVDAGSYYFKGLQGTVTLNWDSHAMNNNAFSVYGGLGIGLGFNWGDNDWYPRFWDTANPNYKQKWDTREAIRRYWFAGIAGNFGLEYRFDVPLSIAFEYRPMIGFEIGKKYFPNGNNPNQGSKTETPTISNKIKICYHTPGLWAFAIAARYMF